MNDLLNAERPRIAFVCVATLVAVFIVGRNALLTPIEKQTAILQDTVVVEQEKGEVLERIVALEQEINMVRPRMARTRDIETLVGTINSLAEEAGLVLTSVVPRKPKPHNRYLSLPVELELSCTYHQLGEFLSRLESAEQFLKVDRVDMTRQRRGRSTGRGLTTTIVVSGFYPVS